MALNDEEKIKIASEYFVRRTREARTSSSSSMRMQKSIFQNSASDRAASHFWKWLRDSMGSWNTFNTITTDLISSLPVTIWSLRGLHTAKWRERPGQEARLRGAVSATSSSFETAESRAYTSISIPIIRVTTKHGFDGERIVRGETVSAQPRS